MKEYKRYVEEAREKKEDFRFANSSTDHAKILIENIILDANRNIKILTDSFNEFFYNQLKENFINFLKKDANNKLEIILSSKEKNSLLDELKSKFLDQVSVILIDKEKLPKDKETEEIVNYIVNDNNAFRYEYSDKDLEYGVVEAVANFNNKSDADSLISNFEQIKKVAA
ncbi:hypothetical protein MLC35_01025 [Sulfurimonas sp. NW7]|uniref:hypothetical protein n=1 Tax=Sulfurimonas sp. NW7 TaxID=2922727 RepID=UPI003DA8F6C3